MGKNVILCCNGLILKLVVDQHANKKNGNFCIHLEHFEEQSESLIIDMQSATTPGRQNHLQNKQIYFIVMVTISVEFCKINSLVVNTFDSFSLLLQGFPLLYYP